VLITRPEPGASETALRLSAMGYEPVLAPMMVIERSVGQPALPGELAATVLTSRNAVAFCPPACLDRPAFAVGSATAARARAHGFLNVTDADADASVLPGLIARSLGPNGQALFLPTAQGQGTELAKALRALGFRVLRRVAYRAAPARALPEPALTHLRQAGIGAAMFFSTETARTFVRLVSGAGLAGAVAGTEAFSISERSAVALRALPWRRISVAAKPNQDSMLVLMK